MPRALEDASSHFSVMEAVPHCSRQSSSSSSSASQCSLDETTDRLTGRPSRSTNVRDSASNRRPLPLVFLILLSRLFFVDAQEEQSFTPLTPAFISRLRNESLYNRYATPTQYDGIATNVSIAMYIEGISSFSAQTMDYHLDMYFQQEWYDLRLIHNGTKPILVRDKAIFKLMWHPDVYFANARSASFQDITDDNFLVWVYPDGRVWYDCRISLVVICMMDLWKYPLDSQICEMRILSYAYPESQMRLQWTDKYTAIDRNTEIRMPDMQLIDIRTGHCNGTYATGVWSCMTAVFFVERERMHHVMQTYLPTALIVVISWFNFWLDVDSAPARVSLSITTLLTISTQANAAFVFGVMIEFTICHFAKNQELARGEAQPSLIVDTALSTLFGAARDIDEMNEEDIEGAQSPRHHGNHIALRVMRNDETEPRLRSLQAQGTETMEVSRRALNWTRTIRNLRGRRVANKIDEKCRIVFPSVFILFNVAYWSFYLFFN